MIDNVVNPIISRICFVVVAAVPPAISGGGGGLTR